MRILCLPVLNVLLLFVCLVSVCTAQPGNMSVEPIKQLRGTNQLRGRAIKTQSGAETPHVVDSLEKAREVFNESYITELAEKIDWEQQYVLAFSWAGSGQDKMKHKLEEGTPTRVFFQRLRGKTRDLRHHEYIFALKKGVVWKMTK